MSSPSSPRAPPHSSAPASAHPHTQPPPPPMTTTTSSPPAMDNFSGGLDFEHAPPWDDPPHAGAQKLKFLCSYGGRILPRPHDNRLSYVGGETKIVAVDRSPTTTTFASISARLSSLSNSHVSFKYQLPGHDLDALISVTDDEDLLHMLQEHRRLSTFSPNPPHLRLFLFPSPNRRLPLPHPLISPPTPPLPAPPPPANNLDFLFGLDQEPAVPVPDRMQMLRLQDQSVKNEDKYSEDFHVQKKRVDNVLPVNFTVAGPPPFLPEKGVIGGVFPAGVGDRPVYMVTTPSGVHHAPPFPRPQVTSAYYPLQPRMAAGNVMLEPSTAAAVYGILAPPQQMAAKVMRPMAGELPMQMFYTTGGGNFTPRDSCP